MAKQYFSVNLDVAGKTCLVIGGDEEALEKASRLLDGNARVRLVARDIKLPQLQKIIDEDDRVEFHHRDFQPADVEGCFFVLNAVKSDDAMSRSVWEACKAANILISSYDQGQYCDAVMQAQVAVGPMRINIGSGGTAPVLASSLRRELEKVLINDEYLAYIDWVIDKRKALVDAGMSPKERKEKLKAMLADFALDAKLVYPAAYRNRNK